MKKRRGFVSPLHIFLSSSANPGFDELTLREAKQ
jgi:hypothetical protein